MNVMFKCIHRYIVVKCPCRPRSELGIQKWSRQFSVSNAGKNARTSGRSNFRLSRNRGIDDNQSPRLSPHQVTTILRVNETSEVVESGPIRAFETNQLPSNHPIEDRRCEAKLPIDGDKYLFAVHDGHAGCACAQSLNERLFNYLAVALSPPEIVEKVKNGEIDLTTELLHWYNGGIKYKHEQLKELYDKSLKKFARETLTVFSDDTFRREALANAFMRLDEDISTEALPNASNPVLSSETLTVAFAGSVSCVAYVDGIDLFIANTGDCRAVLGVHKMDDHWEAIPLSTPHDGNNEEEVNRILNRHPNESNNIFKNGRLFGDLAPLRAFGDVRYKWDAKDLKHIVNTSKYPHSFISIYGDRLVPNNYNTPPYLTAEPEITHHKLTPKDKFLVLASDGLWDMVSPEKVVQLVAGHMDGRQVLVHFTLPRENMTLGEINKILTQRKKGLANKNVDENVATHLIRNAIGQDHGQLSAQLTLPNSISRFYRDDITVTVIYFNSEYIMDYSTSNH
ncbi:hypothetical protein LOTGIDRAFT_184585 [Lottia gigantea]|uniref:PPM-type phosphatase domain-containing protein n=1 Tax=Lottia gigantea TaxID=225164 RepID=V3ZPK5_LOTGI|nr:hypothetical protein LOTGIDRAFT_184585 [Lottia gigantea]ESO82786.1 hypothetical protein LOTGIDRAFT_184585 [Lottia gigantea]